jgi:acid phosphatase type 7
MRIPGQLIGAGGNRRDRIQAVSPGASELVSPVSPHIDSFMKISLTQLGRCVRILLLGLFVSAGVLQAGTVRETIDGFLGRIGEVLSPPELVKLEPAAALALMSEEERLSLSRDYLGFSLDRPGVVYVAFHEHPTGPVFWLTELGFEPTETRVEIARLHWRLWRKAYPAGPVRLGIPALHAFVPTYFVFVTAGSDGLPAVAQSQPEWAAVLPARAGLSVYHDVNFPLPANLPEVLEGSVLVQNSWANRRGYHVLGKYRLTAQPSGPVPDQVVLTWSEDPTSSQTIQWRTQVGDDVAQVQYLPREEWMRRQDRPEARAVSQPRR